MGFTSSIILSGNPGPGLYKDVPLALSCLKRHQLSAPSGQSILQIPPLWGYAMIQTSLNSFFHSLKITNIASNCNTIVILEPVNQSICQLPFPPESFILLLQLSKSTSHLLLNMPNTFLFHHLNILSATYILNFTKTFAVRITKIFCILQFVPLLTAPKFFFTPTVSIEAEEPK